MLEDGSEYIVEWALQEDAAVALLLNWKRVGVFHVQDFGPHHALLSCSETMFQVGTRLVVDDFQGLLGKHSKPLLARVKEVELDSMRIVW
jgi:hypothetical protein